MHTFDGASLLEELRRETNAFYKAAIQTQLDPWIEFTTLMHSWIRMLERTRAMIGLSRDHLSGVSPLMIHPADTRRIAEPFNLLFGNALHRNHPARTAFLAALIDDKEWWNAKVAMKTATDQLLDTLYSIEWIASIESGSADRLHDALQECRQLAAHAIALHNGSGRKQTHGRAREHEERDQKPGEKREPSSLAELRVLEERIQKETYK